MFTTRMVLHNVLYASFGDDQEGCDGSQKELEKGGIGLGGCKVVGSLSSVVQTRMENLSAGSHAARDLVRRTG